MTQPWPGEHPCNEHAARDGANAPRTATPKEIHELRVRRNQTLRGVAREPCAEHFLEVGLSQCVAGGSEQIVHVRFLALRREPFPECRQTRIRIIGSSWSPRPECWLIRHA